MNIEESPVYIISRVFATAVNNARRQGHDIQQLHQDMFAACDSIWNILIWYKAELNDNVLSVEFEHFIPGTKPCKLFFNWPSPITLSLAADSVAVSE